MQVTVNGKEFKAALGASRTIPGMQDTTVLLRTEEDSLLLEAGTGGNFLTVRIPAVVEEAGKLAVDGEALGGLSLPSPTLTLKSQGGAKLGFASGRMSGTTVQYQDGRMTAIESHRPTASLPLTSTLSVAGILQALKATRVMPAMEQAGHGTRLRLADASTYLSCTDVFRAARYIDRIEGCSGDLDIFANTDFLLGLFAYSEADVVQAGAYQGLMRLQASNFEAYMPLLQAKQDIVDGFINTLDYAKCLGAVRLPTKDLRSCLASSSSIVGSKGYESRMQFQRASDEIAITAESARGSATTTHDVQAPDRDITTADFRVTLSVRYLSELLGIFPGDTVDIYVWPNLVQLEQPGGAYTSILPTVVA